MGDPLAVLARVVMLGLVGTVLIVGVVGPTDPAENLATVFTWPVWIAGLAVLATIVGDPWPLLSPWRTVYDALVALEGEPIAVLGNPPTWLGRWPAVLGIVALLGVLDPLTVVPSTPRLTTVLVATYLLGMLGGALLYGRPWLRQADPLAVYYRLLGRVAPLTVEADDTAYTLSTRRAWDTCSTPVADRSSVAAVVAILGVTLFDAASGTPPYRDLYFGLRDTLETTAPVGLLVLFAALGAVAVLVTIGGLVAPTRGTAPGARSPGARRFAPTLLPIAAAVLIVHNVPAILDNTARLLSRVVPGVVAPTPTAWIPTVGYQGSTLALVWVGHAIAVLAASKATDTSGHPGILAVQAVVTGAALWVLSLPVVVP